MDGLVSIDTGRLVDGVFSGIDGLFTSDEERENAKLKAQQELNKPYLLQAIANIKSAENTNWFVAGARPALLWICAAALLYNWLIKDFIIIAIVVSHDKASEIVPLLPSIDGAGVLGLVAMLLGLTTVRMNEKIKGVAREQR